MYMCLYNIPFSCFHGSSAASAKSANNYNAGLLARLCLGLIQKLSEKGKKKQNKRWSIHLDFEDNNSASFQTANLMWAPISL